MRRALDNPALGHWPEIFASESFTDAQLSGKNTQCPLCGGRDRFRFDNKEGRGTWICSHCGAGDGWDLLVKMTNKSFGELAKDIRERFHGIAPDKIKPPTDYRPMLNRLWSESRPHAIEVRRYMGSRGLPASMGNDALLRFHPRCPWSDGTAKGFAPAMLARVYQDGKPATIHRTFLSSDAPVRKMLMPHNGKLNGCYIPLMATHMDSNGCMGVAEGIETALSSSLLHHQDSGSMIPVWATYCADQLERFNPPDTVSKLLIFGDNDATFTGQASAYLLAKRATKKEVTCNVLIPATVGEDFNDVLRRQGTLFEARTGG